MNQHYIPQFYQKGWEVKVNGQKNQIYVYRKNKQPKYYSIKRRVGCEEDYYSFTKKDGSVDKSTVELQLATLDTKTNNVLKKVGLGLQLNFDEKKVLAEFICVFWRRVPYHKLDHDKKLRQLAPEYFSRLCEEVKNLGVAEDSHVFNEIKRLEQKYSKALPDSFYPKSVTRDSEIVNAILAMDWTFIVAPKFMPFVTCDNPFIFSRGPGIGDLQYGHIIFPISRSLVLQITQFTAFRDSYQHVHELLAYEINKRIVSNAYIEVYANYKSAPLTEFVNKWISSDLPEI